MVATSFGLMCFIICIDFYEYIMFYIYGVLLENDKPPYIGAYTYIVTTRLYYIFKTD